MQSDEISEGGFAVALEVDCLQQKDDIGDNILRELDKGKKDIGNVAVKDVITGPLKTVFPQNGKWEFPDYREVRKKFERVKKLNREQLYNSFISKILSQHIIS